jgi:hypothetical protein
VNQTGFNIFEVIGLLADAFDLRNFDVSTVQEPNGLFPPQIELEELGTT